MINTTKKHTHWIFNRFDKWRFEFISNSYKEARGKLDNLLRDIGYKNDEIKFNMRECVGSCAVGDHKVNVAVHNHRYDTE